MQKRIMVEMHFLWLKDLRASHGTTDELAIAVTWKQIQVTYMHRMKNLKSETELSCLRTECSQTDRDTNLFGGLSTAIP